MLSRLSLNWLAQRDPARRRQVGPELQREIAVTMSLLEGTPLSRLPDATNVARYVRDRDQQRWRRCVGSNPLAPTTFDRSSAYAARSASTSSSRPSITMVGGVRSDPSGRATFPSETARVFEAEGHRTACSGMIRHRDCYIDCYMDMGREVQSLACSREKGRAFSQIRVSQSPCPSSRPRGWTHGGRSGSRGRELKQSVR
jgi:hypothetical protein